VSEAMHVKYLKLHELHGEKKVMNLYYTAFNEMGR
jgi:hypothetical protein